MRNHPTTILLCLAASLAALPAQPQQPSAPKTAPTVDLSLRPGQTPSKVPAPSNTQSAATAPRPAQPLLPAIFAGWEAKSPQPLANPSQADPTNAAALKEYGYTDGLAADYARDGETLKVKALRFVDASGAYGAYTLYRQSGWPKEQIGTGAASDHNRILFWLGNVVVDAQLPHVSAMTGSEMRELAATIPLPSGNKTLAPPILATLPQADLDPQATHYALGPAGYAASGGVLPPALVDFDRGAETVTAGYTLSSGPATLTIINYPTPQIAQAQERDIAAYLKAGNSPQHPFTKALLDSNQTALEVKRSGPLVAVVSGDPIQDDAHRLLESVHYEAEMAGEAAHSTQPFQASVQKTARLLLGIVTMVAILFAAALLLALFLGGGRALYRIARGKPASSIYDIEFIKLNLSS
jgi:hypothetical protein